MATLMVRDIDDAQYRRLTQIAKANNRSVSAEVRAIIEERDREVRRHRVIAETIEFLDRNPFALPGGTTSIDLLREERDSW